MFLVWKSRAFEEGLSVQKIRGKRVKKRVKPALSCKHVGCNVAKCVGDEVGTEVTSATYCGKATSM